MSITNESGLLVESLQAQLKGKLLGVTLGERGKPIVTIVCARCGKEVSGYLSQLKTRKFCDEDCRKERFEERFWKKVNKSGNDSGCWIWTGSLNRDGYGQFPCVELNQVRANRISWILINGPISDGLFVLHKQHCKSRACVNPDHLYLGTQIDNMQDAVAVGTHYKSDGEEHPNSLLNNESVKEIRLKYNLVEVSVLAAQFQVTVGTIRDVAKGRSWQSVEPRNYWEAQGITRKTRKDNIGNLK